MRRLGFLALLSIWLALPAAAQSGTFTLQLVGNSVWNAGANGCPVAGTKTASCALPNMSVGTPYSYTLSVSGGIPPYKWVTTGLPTCLTGTVGNPDTSTFALSGTPTSSCTGGGAGLSVTVTDSSPKTLATITGTVVVASN
jgi:hypothetical protein